MTIRAAAALAILIGGCADQPTSPSNPLTAPPGADFSELPPDPVPVSSEDWQSIQSGYIDGLTRALPYDYNSYIFAKMTIRGTGEVDPLPAYLIQSVYGRSAKDHEIPITRHQTFQGTLIYPSWTRQDVLDMPLNCEEVQIGGSISGSTSHVANWALTHGGVGVQHSAEAHTEDGPEYCEIQGDPIGPGGEPVSDMDCQIHYMCLDVWDEEDNVWVEVWCGYLQVCG